MRVLDAEETQKKVGCTKKPRQRRHDVGDVVIGAARGAAPSVRCRRSRRLRGSPRRAERPRSSRSWNDRARGCSGREARYVASESAASSAIASTSIEVVERLLSSTMNCSRRDPRSLRSAIARSAQSRDRDERRFGGREEGGQQHEHDEHGDLVREQGGATSTESVFNWRHYSIT